jgi:hypothetical protein
MVLLPDLRFKCFVGWFSTHLDVKRYAIDLKIRPPSLSNIDISVRTIWAQPQDGVFFTLLVCILRGCGVFSIKKNDSSAAARLELHVVGSAARKGGDIIQVRVTILGSSSCLTFDHCQCPVHDRPVYPLGSDSLQIQRCCAHRLIYKSHSPPNDARYFVVVSCHLL